MGLGAAGVLVVVLVAGYFLVVKDSSEDGDKNGEIPSDVPAECETDNLVTVKSEEAGTVNPEVANSYFKHWRTDSALLVLASYEVDPADIYSNITGDRVLTVIKLDHADGTALSTGVFYNADTVAGAAVNKEAPEFNISTADLAGAVFDENATVNLKFMNDKYACGEIVSDDGSSSINGNFIAKYLSE